MQTTDQEDGRIDVSARDVYDTAYRSLRVTGCPPGVAAEAAHTTVYLEAVRGFGLALIDDLLNRPPSGLGAAARTVPGENGGVVECGAASALLLGPPLVALAEERRHEGPLTLLCLTDAAALEAPMAAAAARRSVVFSASAGGELIVRVEPGSARTGPAWRAAAEGTPLDVVVTCAAAEPALAPTNPPAAPVVGRVDAATWRCVSGRARKFLV